MLFHRQLFSVGTLPTPTEVPVRMTTQVVMMTTELVGPVGCEAGTYLTERGCEQCGENSFSAAEDDVCTPCPGGTTSPAGSVSHKDCVFIGKSTFLSVHFGNFNNLNGQITSELISA